MLCARYALSKQKVWLGVVATLAVVVEDFCGGRNSQCGDAARDFSWDAGTPVRWV